MVYKIHNSYVTMFRLLLVSLVTVVVADYDCICNYNSDYPVHDQPADNVDTLGYLAEFDCKEKLPAFSTSKYTAISYDHMVGYIVTNAQIQSRVCPGKPNQEDILTTTAMSSIPTTSGPPTTTTVLMTTPQPSTRMPMSTTMGSQSTTTYIPSSSSAVPGSSSTSSTRTLPQSATTTSSQQPQTTQSPVMQTSKPVTKDNLRLCSKTLQDSAKRYNYAIGQFNQSCYLLRTVKTSFFAAQRYCKGHGGNLFDVSNVYEQDYIMSFLTSHGFKDEVWMGLEDKANEENFRWTSGEKLTYTNWYPYRKDDIDRHSVEDCAVLIPFPPFNGQWDDLHCGTVFFNSANHAHSYICQFGVHPENLQPYPGSIIG